MATTTVSRVMMRRAAVVYCTAKNTGFQATFKTHDTAYNPAILFHSEEELMSLAKKMEKQIIMVVHAAPNTQPGGVHGALFNEAYQSEPTPSPVKDAPIASPPKFNTRNKTNSRIMLGR